jgi:hypothetical protein
VKEMMDSEDERKFEIDVKVDLEDELICDLRKKILRKKN